MRNVIHILKLFVIKVLFINILKVERLDIMENLSFELDTLLFILDLKRLYVSVHKPK